VDRYGVQQSLLDQNRTTTTTTRTTRRFGHDASGGGTAAAGGGGGGLQQQQIDVKNIRREQVISPNPPEIDEKFLQSKIHITRKYKGKKEKALFFFENFFFRKYSYKIC
jgi:hypothetical protein